MDNLAGQHIKGYELHERIAAGGFGAVYRAYQSTVGREVAIKVILPGLANKPEFIRRFEAEAQLIARLEHMNIVPLHDYWRDPDGAYLVMRYLRGGSLYDKIKSQGAYTIEDALNLFAQVAQGLHVAHRNHIIHRDIKPGNILLDEDGNGFLADFGIAKDHTIANGITEPDVFIGSPEYLAPEQARSEAVTPQTDIYSLGVVLHEMLSGTHPFPNLEKIEIIFKHLNDPLPEITSLDDNISDAVNEVIKRATAKDPKQRFADVMEMLQVLREAAQLDAIPTPTSVVELLTPREQEVMQLIIDGRSNREIADILVLAETTVKSYITNMYRKLKVRSRVQAIARARDLNFVIQKPKTGTSIHTGRLPEPENPYKGLKAFQAADAQDFFGREKLIQKLLSRLQETVDYQRFLAVVGPSGSGKSSVVKAGLIPCLWRGDLPASENWYIVDMLPGAHPLDELEVALFQIASDKSINLREQLVRDERGLVRVADMILPDDRSELLLVIDQFEEVFTLLYDESERQHFLNLLREAVSDKRSRLRIIVTLRADYYDRPLQYPEFGELIRSRAETVLPLGAEELARAIQEPGQQAGVLFEDGLVSRIVSDVHYQPGALPLLQYALTELFEHRDGRRLTLEAYEKIGGTGGALANRADEIYLEGNDAAQELVRQLFLRLVTLGEGAEDTRRRVERAELLKIAPASELMEEIIDLYANSRLLSLDNDPATRQPTVEVAHEAILREWERLRGWLTESRDDIRQEQGVARASTEWETNNHESSFLLRGSRLEQIEKWLDTTTLTLTPLERRFIAESIQIRQAEQEAQSKRIARENALEQRSKIVLRALVAVFAVASVVAIALSIIAIRSGNEATRERDNAQANFTRAERIRLAAQAQIALDRGEDVRIPALLALRSLELGYSPEADGALLTALGRDFSRQVYVGHTGDGIVGITFSPDGNHILTASTDGTARLWDTLSGEEVQQFVGHAGMVMRAIFAPDGTFVLTAGNDGTLRQWDIQTGQETHRLLEQDNLIFMFAISPNSQFLAVTEFTDTAYIYAFPTMELVHKLEGHVDSVRNVNFSPDSHSVVTTSEDNSARLWDVETGLELQRFEGHASSVWDVKFSPIDNVIGTVSEDGTARLWNIETGAMLQRLVTPTQLVSLDFSPDGRRLVGSGQDRIVRIWDTETGAIDEELQGHTAQVGFVAFSPDGQFIASAGTDNMPRLWDVQVESEPRLYTMPFSDLHAESVLIALLIEGDQKIITILRAGRVRIWDVASYQIDYDFTINQGGNITSAILSHSRDQLFTASEDGIIRQWDINNGELLQEFNLEVGNINSIQLSSDDKQFVVGTDDGTAMLWSIDESEPLRQFEGHTEAINAVDLSDDQPLLVTAGDDGTIRLWDKDTGDEIRQFAGHQGAVNSVAFSPDGRSVLAGGLDQQAHLWDLETGELIRDFVGHTLPVRIVAFSPDGRTIITGSWDQTIRLWDSQTGESIRQLVGHDSPVLSLSMSLDGKLLASGDLGIAYLWRTDLNDIVALTCEKIAYDLTVGERATYEIHDDFEVCD